MKKGKNVNHPEKGSTIKVEPIRNVKNISAIRDLLEDHPRNLGLFTFGVNTNLRVGDLLKTRVGHVIHLKEGDRLELPGSRSSAFMNRECIEAVQGLTGSMKRLSGREPHPDDYFFKGRKGALTIQAVNNLVKKWCARINLKGNYGSHTLRKTFGYQKLMNGSTSLPELMALFNHHSQVQTLEYLCVSPEEYRDVSKRQNMSVSQVSDHSDTETVQSLNRMIMELKESEEKFKTFFENANDQIVYTDLAGKVLEVNDATWDIFGQTREEALGKNITELGIFKPETLDVILEQSKITAQDNPPPRMELEAFHRDGSLVYIDVNSKLMKKDGNIIGIISIVRDITDRKRVEAALQESREMSRALLNATTDSVMLLDANGIILDLNASYAEKFNRNVEETIGLCLWDLLPSDMTLQRKEKFDQVFQSGKSVRLEEEYKGRWFDNIVYPVMDRNKRVSSVAIFSHDITSRKQAEEALRNHRDKLEVLVKERTAKLEDANTALKVLLKRREEDKVDLEEKMMISVRELVLPFLQDLKITQLDDRQKAILDIIEANINDAVSPFAHGISARFYNLSPTEIRIANIIRQGKSSKEIADILKMSSRTVDNHRYSIRKKLGINNEKANLATHLLSIQ